MATVAGWVILREEGLNAVCMCVCVYVRMHACVFVWVILVEEELNGLQKRL